MFAGERERLEGRAREALSRLASVREMGGKIMIDLPIMYPSGAMAVVEVERNGDRVWVSDCGHGLVEAEFAGAIEFYARAAEKIAKEYSVSYDGYAIFALWVSEARLEAAIVAVANASCVASREAIRHATEVQGRRQNEKIYERIARVFGPKIVERESEIAGRRAIWNVHNVVTIADQRRAVFEFMTEHPNSVSNKYLMFSDIRSRNVSISLNAVVSNLQRLDTKAQMISDVANVIQIGADDEVFRSYALAA